MKRSRVSLLVALATVVIFACTTDTLIGPKDVALLVIEPDSVIMPVGDTVLLEGVATDSRGVRYIGEKITWTSSNPSVVTITPDGHLISLTVGSSTVTASAGGKSASAQVTVTPPATIAVSVDSLAFGAVARGPLPASQQIVVTNGSAGVLTGLATGAPVYVGPDTGWLYVTSPSSTAPDSIVFSIGIDTFPVGTYTATVPITATKATNSPKTVKITLTLSAGAPSAVTKTAGDSQTAVVQTALGTAPAVTVKDAYGNAIAGVSVTFATTAGNGALTGASATTNASGIATLGSWTLDTITKTDTLTATVAALPVVEFTATATPAAASQILKTAGDGQTAAVGSLLPSAPAVSVRDRFGNPVAGLTVTFAASAPSGLVTGTTPVTNALGNAAVGSWTLGTTARTDSVTATVPGIGAPAVFTATATAGAATTIAKSAGGTSGTVNVNVAPAPAVLVTDQFGNPVAGVGVTFAATAANGTVTGGSATTNGVGIATVGSFKLATLVRTDTLTATSGSLGGSPVTFAVVAGPDVPSTAAKNAGDAQTAAAGSVLPTAPSVIVKDQFGNPVPSVTVTFAVTGGGGGLTGATPTTNAAGVATLGSWTLGSSAGPNSLSATVGALPVLTFTATATAGAAKTITRLSPGSQSDTIGAGAGTDSVLVTDQLGNPVAGITVTWGIGGAGTLTPAGPTTSASGIAKATRVLGTVPGTVTDTATAVGLTGSPVTFTVTTAIGHALTLSKGAGDSQTDSAGATLPVAYTDTVKDRAGNPVSGVTVTWGVAGGGSITPSSITGVNGVATATRILGTVAGIQTATGTVAGLTGSPTSFSATVTHANAKTLTVVAGTNGQTATVSTAVGNPPAVKVTDQFANPVSGVPVSFALGAGGARNGSITGAAPSTNASGIAALTSWTLGATSGPDTVTATAAGLTGSPATFVDFGNIGGATTIAAAGGNGQTDTVKSTLPRLDSVLVTDGINPVSGVTVSWAVTKGGGTITPTSSTNANGIAVAQWVLGDTAGAQTATATSGVLAGSPVTFTATATAGAPVSLTKNAGDGQTVAAGAAVATAPAALVKDQFNNPVSGVTVTFAPVGASNGNVTGGTPVTNASGIATLGSWTVGTAAKTDSLTATAGAASPVTFTATVTAGGAATIARLGAASQSDTIGGTLPALDSVKVTDTFGNPVAGTTVTWVAGGTGTLTPTTGTTNAAGIATATRVLGTTAGAVTDTAKASGLSGSPITFGVTTNAGQGATLIKGAGDAQTDTVGATLAVAYTDTVKDRAGNPVAGVTVTWAASGGGSITPTSITGANGAASATRILGTVAGAQGATATVTGLTGSPVSFGATANHGAAKLLSAAAGTNGQAATVSTAVGTPPGAKVTDQFGNAISGVTVTFALGAGGARNGAITGLTPSTNGSGIASLTSWTLGASAGPDTVIATVAGLTGSPLTFVDFGNSGAATTMSLAGGNNQTDTVHATLAKLDSVLVTDGTNPISGVTVSWAANKGGSIPPSSVTNANGIAVAQWVLGDTAGTQNATATVGGLIGSPVTFTATANHGAAKTIAVNGGNAQSATVGTTVATAPSVIVKDQFGNPVNAVSVTFAATVRNGSVTGATPTTNGAGIATVGSWQLGGTVGPDTMTATSGGLTGSPVLFTATGTSGGAGSATNIARLGSAAQSDTIGATLAILDSVKVTDQFANPVAGVTVTWGAGGAGSLTPTSGTTNAQGIATATRVLGNTAGVVTDTAKATGLTGSPVTFTTTTTAGHASSIALNGGDSQTDSVGATLATAYTVLIQDRAGNPVLGTTVTWGVTGGGSITPTSISNASGIATATRVLGTATGSQGATATVAGLAGSPVSFTATATAGHATTVTEVAGTNGQSATVATAVTLPPAMKVTDQNGNPVPGVTVTYTLGAGGARNGAITGTAPVTNGSGVATLGSWTLGNTAGPDTVIATAAGLGGSPHTFVDNGAAGSATTMAAAGGNGQTDTVRATLPKLDSVLVTDALSNPVTGVTVTWAVTKGTGAVTPSSLTNANGIATAQWTLGDTAEVQNVTATSGSLSGSPVTFSATATHGNATSVAVNGGNGQTDTVAATLVTAPSVIVKDAYGNPVSGISVTFAVTGGGGSVTGPTPTTNGAGIATVGSWKLGTATGGNTMTATSGTLSGSPVPFTATATAGAPTSMTVSAGNNQTAQINSLLPTALAVLVQDQFSNPVSGAQVNFTTAIGNGSLGGASPVTNGSGIATIGSWTTGSVVKADSAVAALAGVPNVTFVATVTPGGPSSMALSSGDAQTDTIGATLQPLKVLITDAGGNPVPGVSVTWLVTAGSAGVSTPSSTDGTGIAATTVTFNTTLGGVTVQAASAGLTSVNFNETVVTGNPVTLAKNLGDLQSATVNTTVATSPSVKVSDRAGNGVAGVGITYSVPANHGSVTGASTTTGATGIATVGSWTLDSIAGSNTLTATPGISLTPTTVSFSGTGTAGPVSASKSTLVAGTTTITACSSGCVVGTTASTVTVTEVDQFGNPVNGSAVTFASSGTTNTFSPASGSTNSSGVLATTYNSSKAESKTISVAGVTQTAGVTVSPAAVDLTTSTVGVSAASMTACSTSCSTGGGTAVTVTVTVRDGFSNVRPGSSVSISATGTVNTFNPSSGITDANGQVISTFNATLIGLHTVSATANFSTIVQTQNVTVNAAAAATMTVNGTTNSRVARITAGVASPPSVLVKDAFGNVKSGASITFGTVTGGGSIGATPQTTNASGIATLPSWTMGSTGAITKGAHLNTLLASTAGVTSLTFADSGIYTLSSDVQPIWTANCTSCHFTGGTNPNLTSGNSRAATVGVASVCTAGTRIVAGSSATSVLYLRMTGGSCGAMPPSGILGAASTNIVRDWIDNGAQNN